MRIKQFPIYQAPRRNSKLNNEMWTKTVLAAVFWARAPCARDEASASAKVWFRDWHWSAAGAISRASTAPLSKCLVAALPGEVDRAARFVADEKI